MAQAVIRAMAVNAAKGQHRAQRLFSELLSSTEASRKQLHTDYFGAALTYKIEWESELQRRAQNNVTNLPTPLPHPDDIILDMREGTVRIKGPMSQEEKVGLDEWTARKPELREAIAGLKLDLEQELDPDERADIEKHIRMGEKLLDKLKRAVPDREVPS